MHTVIFFFFVHLSAISHFYPVHLALIWVPWIYSPTILIHTQTIWDGTVTMETLTSPSWSWQAERWSLPQLAVCLLTVFSAGSNCFCFVFFLFLSAGRGEVIQRASLSMDSIFGFTCMLWVGGSRIKGAKSRMHQLHGLQHSLIKYYPIYASSQICNINKLQMKMYISP